MEERTVISIIYGMNISRSRSDGANACSGRGQRRVCLQDLRLRGDLLADGWAWADGPRTALLMEMYGRRSGASFPAGAECMPAAGTG